jgi:type I restriction enzyme S subunit
MSETKLPESWRIAKLDEVIQMRRDGIHPDQAPHLIYVGLEHIDSSDAQLKRWGNPSEVKSAKNQFYPGDVLYGKLRPYLDKAVLAETEGMCSTDILVFTPTSKATSEFVAFLLHTQGIIDHAISTTSGVNHPRTSWSDLRKYTFSLPPLPEQRAIAHALHAVQQAREARQREIALERERKAALMGHLFTHGPQAKDIPAQETRFGKVPKHWQIVPLSDCSFVQTGVTKGRKFGNEATMTVPYLRVANVQDGHLDLSEIKEIRIRKSELDRYRLQFGDVVLTEGGDFDKLGRGFIWRGEIPDCTHQNHIFAVRVNRDMLQPEYFAYLVQSNYGKAYFLSVAHRTTNLASINGTKLKALPTLVPPFPEQQEIINILNACDAKIASLEHESALLEELFRALLEELMTGRLSAKALIEI